MRCGTNCWGYHSGTLSRNQVSAVHLEIGHPQMKPAGTRSLNGLHWLDLNIGYQDSFSRNIRQVTYPLTYSRVFYMSMGLLPDTSNCRLRMHRECRERFPRHRGLAIPTCIMARARRTCRDACRDRLLAVSFEVGGGGNVPSILGTCATRSFTYLVRGP